MVCHLHDIVSKKEVMTFVQDSLSTRYEFVSVEQSCNFIALSINNLIQEENIKFSQGNTI